MALLLAAFFVYPLGRTVWQSVYEYGFTLRSYQNLIDSTLFWKVLRTTFEISFSATLVCLLAGYPVALHLSRLSPSRSLPLA